MSSRPLIDERGQQVNESFRISVIRMPALAHEAGTAVQVPTNDEHGRARLEQRLPKAPEIIGAVDQNRGAPRPARDARYFGLVQESQKTHRC